MGWFVQIVDMLSLVTYPNRKLVFEWYGVKCDSKNLHQKLFVYKRLTILGSIVNVIGGGRDLL